MSGSEEGPKKRTKRPPSKAARDVRRSLARLSLSTPSKLNCTGLGFEGSEKGLSREASTQTLCEWVPGGTLDAEKARFREERAEADQERVARETPGEARMSEVCHAVGGDPVRLYRSLSATYQRRTVEDVKYLNLALRSVARRSPRGRNICWPAPEAEDRLRLRVAGLPTNGEQLLQLLHDTFEERGEPLNLDEVIGDFAKQYGRVTYQYDRPYAEMTRVVRM